jgi:hypothetical protein
MTLGRTNHTRFVAASELDPLAKSVAIVTTPPINTKLTPVREPELTWLNMLHEIIGYVENGSSQKLVLFQDDATKDYCIMVGRHGYTGPDLGSVINLAYYGEKQE